MCYSVIVANFSTYVLHPISSKYIGDAKTLARCVTLIIGREAVVRK